MQQAPFTSDAVLEAFSKKESGFSVDMIRDILCQLPQTMRDQINEGRNIRSEKEQMEIDINTHRRERNLAINQAVQLLASDTIDRTGDMIEFLENTGDIQYEYRLAKAYDVIGDSEQAESVLTAIGDMELAENEAERHNDYMSFRQLMQTWATEDKHLAALSESDLELLQGYTQNANATAGQAITLLELNGIDTYKEPVYFPDETEPQLRIMQCPEEEIKEEKLLLYPNPANEYLVVEYALIEDNQDVSLVITNTNGQVLFNQQLDYAQDELIIITDKFPTGQYFCTLYNKGNILKTDKFLLVR